MKSSMIKTASLVSRGFVRQGHGMSAVAGSQALRCFHMSAPVMEPELTVQQQQVLIANHLQEQPSPLGQSNGPSSCHTLHFGIRGCGGWNVDRRRSCLIWHGRWWCGNLGSDESKCPATQESKPWSSSLFESESKKAKAQSRKLEKIVTYTTTNERWIQVSSGHDI